MRPSLTDLYIYIFTVIYSPLRGFIWNQHNDQLTLGFLAQLVERCPGIVNIMSSNPLLDIQSTISWSITL